ncbi:hypothetical protein CVT26_003856 [Gymnopilus dilepis]|uniref:DNA-directed RNA polymerase III subunit n=1 Tax=Gymnopilus dilepis TaxID=231916 RepID=A0A409YV09_9AGAR|nr:hypothetical protein CVT26_003856 [Gymnopilus dilepis]
MSRGGGRGGRGGGRGGRGGFGGANNLPPMGLTFADIQNLSREATAMYPSRELPVFTEPSDDEKKIAQLQLGFATRLRKSQYYIVEKTKTTGLLVFVLLLQLALKAMHSYAELERYSDKYRPSVASQPSLKRSDLHEPFFPSEVFEDYFNPRRKKKLKPQTKGGKAKLDLDALEEGGEEEEKSLEERSEPGSEADEDYDVDEEYDNDYAENYFDNGEGDDMDDLGGGGGDEGGGGGDYD